MPRFFVDQGLVNSRDQSLLKPGELNRADDSYYKPGDPGLWIVPSRTLYNSTPEAASIVGVRFLGFDTVADIIVVHHSTVYRRGPATATGAFVDLVTGLTGGTSLDSIYYNGTHTLMNGVDRARVVDSTYANILLGMLPNVGQPTINETGGVGPGFKITVGKIIWYWIEEQYRDAAGHIIKRSALGQTITGDFYYSTILGDGTTLYKPRISHPAFVNPDTTHWAVYATGAVLVNSGGGFSVLRVLYPGAQVGEATAATAFIDDTRTGTDPGLPSGPMYETMAVSVAGTFFTVPRNAPPPIFSTGDVMEESFVVNDVSDRSIVRYSWEETIHAYPALNFIKFAEKEQNEVRVIRMVGMVMVVLLRDSAWRIDYLPRPSDAEFNRGRCRSRIPGAPGVVNNVNAAAVFSMGDKYFLAYVSSIGPVMTDGHTQNVLTPDLDWPSMVNMAALDKCTLVFNEEKYQVEIRYPATGSSVANKILLVNVHPSHLKANPGGGFAGKVSGPAARPSTAATAALISDQIGIYSAQGTSLYFEWNGQAATDPATAVPIELICRSGDVYLSDLGKQANVERVWIHHNIGSGNITGHLLTKNEGQSDTDRPWSIGTSRREATSWYLGSLSEGIVYGGNILSPSIPMKINYFVIDGEESGDAKD